MLKKRKNFSNNNYFLNFIEFEIHQPENWLHAVLFSLFLVFFPQLLIILLPSPISSLMTTWGWKNNISELSLQTAWEVTAGLIGITFVIVIFVVEIANSNKYGGKAFRVFFAETKLLFTASYGIFVIISIGITSILLSNSQIPNECRNSLITYQWVLFFINSILIIGLFIRTVKIQNKSHFLLLLRKYNQWLTNQIVNAELFLRIANTKSFELFKLMGIDFDYFEPEPNPKMITLNITCLDKQIYRITDINFKLIEIAYKNAKKIYPDLKKNDFIYYARIERSLSNEKPGLAMVNPLINRKCVYKYIKNSVRCSEYTSHNKSDLSEELVINKDLIIQSIKNREYNSVKELLDHHIDLIESFLEAINNYGLNFNQKSALKEMNLFFSDWKLVTEIINQLIDVSEVAFFSNDSEIIRTILHIPRKCMEKAVTYNDHLIYQQFSRLYTRFYYFLFRSLQDTTHVNSIIDNIYRILIDHRRFFLTPRLKNYRYQKEKVIEIVDYYKDLLLIWNSLIKGALDEKTINRFSIFTEEVRNIVKDIFPDVDKSSLMIIDSQLNNEPKNIRFIEEKEDIECILNLKKELEIYRDKMMLGFGGYITHQYEISNFSLDDFFNFIPAVHTSFLDINNLHDSFSNNFLDNEDDLFNWSSWEMSEWSSQYGDVSSGTLTYRSWIDKYFVLRSLELIQSKNTNTITLTPYSNSESIYDSVTKIIGVIPNDKKWIDLLNRANVINIEERITVLESILRAAYIREKSIEEQITISSSLSEEITLTFKNNLIKSWKQHSLFRNLFRNYGKYQICYINVPEEISTKKIEIRQFVPKELFIKQNRVVYGGWEESIGQYFAEYEDYHIGKILKSEEYLSIDSESFIEIFNSKLQIMTGRGLKPIIFINGKEIFTRINKASEFTPSWRLRSNAFSEIPIQGLFENFPVVLTTVIPENTCFLLDILQYGTFVDYIFEKDSEPISINISEISIDKAIEIINNNPDWLKDNETNETLPNEVAVQKVLLKAKIELSTFSEFIDINPKAATSIILEKNK